MKVMYFKTFLLRYLKFALSLLFWGLLCSSAYFSYQWWHAHQLNIKLLNGSLVQHPINLEEQLSAYNIGYLNALDNQVQKAVKAFTYAETSNNPEVRARAKFALGNIYFGLAMKSANISAGGAHQQAVAQIELAREAYKGALRLKPDFYDARYNLELLDRQSPDRRTQAWKAETDGVTLQPFKRNGTAMMRDNTRRGLP